MKLLFVHDHLFHAAETIVYSSKLPYSVWLRYLESFQCITVFSRRSSAAFEKTKYSVSSGPDVSFVFGESVSSLSSLFTDRKKQKAQLCALVEASDCVVARLPSEFGLMAVDLAHETGKPVVVEVVGCGWDALWNYGSLVAKLYAPLLYLRMRAAVKKADAVIYVTARFLQKRYPCYQNAESANVSNVEMDIPPVDVLEKRLIKISNMKACVIGLIGSLNANYKGVDTAIKALARLKSRAVGSQYQLRILGDGCSKRYVALAKRLGVDDMVLFDGSLPGGNSVFSWLDSVDIYIQPSFTEGVPRSLIEAMSRGCPAIGSTAGGIPELLDDSQLFRAGDYRKLTALIECLRSDECLMLKQAKRNFSFSERFDRKFLNERRTRLFSNLLN